MFGIRFFKSSPSQYVFQVRNGRVVREGTGLAFFYFAPQSSLVSVPLGAVDVPFMFEEITSDFQTVSLQGNIRYRIANPKAAIEQQDFSLLGTGEYASEDPQKLSSKILNSVKAQFRTLLQNSDLRMVLQATDSLSKNAKRELSANANLAALGIEIGELSLLAAKPTPDTARALEAAVREKILKEADDAIYQRRNAAIEQERSVKENELRSELIIEEKKRLVRETQVETERAVLEK
jgi:regulator of protease activity HflC (stomatin/prohibitin superfamily)